MNMLAPIAQWRTLCGRNDLVANSGVVGGIDSSAWAWATSWNARCSWWWTATNANGPTP